MSKKRFYKKCPNCDNYIFPKMFKKIIFKCKNCKKICCPKCGHNELCIDCLTIADEKIYSSYVGELA